MSKEQDMQIAEKLFGWKWYHGYDGGHYSLLLSPDEYNKWVNDFGKSGERHDGANDLTQLLPEYTRKPADDYLVLVIMRETYDIRKEGGIFNAALYDIWLQRGRKNKRTMWTWCLYEPGDYSLAALEALQYQFSKAINLENL